jgi:hypothetical protein
VESQEWRKRPFHLCGLKQPVIACGWTFKVPLRPLMQMLFLPLSALLHSQHSLVRGILTQVHGLFSTLMSWVDGYRRRLLRKANCPRFLFVYAV